MAYGDLLSNKDDFYPSLVENFTIDDEFYCAPKDFSTLALVINTDLWGAAGLTEADVPTTWEELDAVSATLTTGGAVGLAFGTEYQRVGTFMAQAGGGLVVDGAAVADSPENVEALEYVQAGLEAGSFAYASDVGAGWGGEAFGKGLAAMVIEGNWIGGAMSNDFPDVNYMVDRAAGRPRRPRHPAVHELLGHGRRQPQPGGRPRPRRVPDRGRSAARVLRGVRPDAVGRSPRPTRGPRRTPTSRPS